MFSFTKAMVMFLERVVLESYPGPDPQGRLPIGKSRPHLVLSLIAINPLTKVMFKFSKLVDSRSLTGVTTVKLRNNAGPQRAACRGKRCPPFDLHAPLFIRTSPAANPQSLGQQAIAIDVSVRSSIAIKW
jgi:hypothetical protein